MSLSDREESQPLIVDKTQSKYGIDQESQDGRQVFSGQNEDFYSQVHQIQEKDLNIKVCLFNVLSTHFWSYLISQSA